MNKTERKLVDLAGFIEHDPHTQGVRHIEVVPQLNMPHHDEDDQYVYHITTKPNAANILKQGFRLNTPALMTNYSNHSTGKIFFTERPGISYWLERVEQHAFHNFDDPPPVVLLRVPKSAIKNLLHTDPIGSKDAHVPCYYITQPFK